MEKFATKREAAQNWVATFNAIPMGAIEKLYERNPDEFSEITPVTLNRGDLCTVYGDRVSVVRRDGDLITIEDERGNVSEVTKDELMNDYYDVFPMWGTMWTFSDMVDEWWLEEKDGLQIMADCGFRIYQNEDFGYLFGIDGAGYDFYEEHWIPLYEARGLHWHKEE